RRAWNVEMSVASGPVSEQAIARVLAAINPLRAVGVVKLKVSPSELSSFGLDTPLFTVAVDLESADAIRKNVLVGDRTEGGYFATVGASDAVFVLSDQTVDDLSSKLVEER
ncbi:MAG: DUF4340 domain-containing protein, partial [Kiritimatiellae bacterium]|nr:DUF4340 domain-containing protein [Kiritimatiellia bacterium]